MTEFYDLVPKDRVANMEWRIRERERCARDAGYRAAVLTACREDVLYFLNGWAFLYEPRKRYDSSGRPLPKTFPFITWPHQDEWIKQAYSALGSRDIVIEKCRDEGASWVGVLFAAKDWLFGDHVKIGIASSTEAKSDSRNMGSIMAKLDWELGMLPRWMSGVKKKDWDRNLSEHTLDNYRTGGQITAFAAKADTARGDRFSWFLIDELASREWKVSLNDYLVMDALVGATDSRLIPSTPNGADGQFYDLIHTPSNILKITIDWRENITKNRGLYKFVNGIPEAVDADNPLPADYSPPSQDVLNMFSRLRRRGYTLEGSIRSPWYDNYCDRASSTPQSVAKELDRSYGGSTFAMFDDEFMGYVNKSVAPPHQAGDFQVSDDGEYRYVRADNGPFKLWCPLDHVNRPPKHSYVICGDIASGQGGTYSSNSVLHVIDLTTKEQVLEYATNTVKPDRFAEIAVAMCKWFHDAYLAWEHMGPGTAFTTHVVERLKYTNVYRRPKTKSSGAFIGPRGGVGWINNKPEDLENMVSDLITAVRQERLVIRSVTLKDEFKQYVKEDGVIRHALHRTATDDAKGRSHGDRVIAIGVGAIAMKDRVYQDELRGVNEDNQQTTTGPPPIGTMAYRTWLHEQDERADRYEWDDRSTGDMRGGLLTMTR